MCFYILYTKSFRFSNFLHFSFLTSLLSDCNQFHNAYSDLTTVVSFHGSLLLQEVIITRCHGSKRKKTGQRDCVLIRLS